MPNRQNFTRGRRRGRAVRSKSLKRLYEAGIISYDEWVMGGCQCGHGNAVLPGCCGGLPHVPTL